MKLLQQLAEVAEDISLLLRGRRRPPMPVEPYTHPRFGTFRQYQNHSFYGSVPVEWRSETIELWPATTVDQVGKRSAERIDPEGFAVAESLLADQDTWQDRLREVVLRDLYPAWHDDWWQGQGTELSPGAFWDRLTVKALTCSSADEFTFDLEARELFGEHDIVAHGSLSGGMEEAYYEG